MGRFPCVEREDVILFLKFWAAPSGHTRQSGFRFSSEPKDTRGSKSIENNNFDNENNNFDNENNNFDNENDNCNCRSFSLDLTNEIKTKHSAREGSYIQSSSIINGFKYWISSNGKSAIWYIKENVWCIGDVDNMSTSLCRLVRVSSYMYEISGSCSVIVYKSKKPPSDNGIHRYHIWVSCCLLFRLVYIFAEFVYIFAVFIPPLMFYARLKLKANNGNFS